MARYIQTAQRYQSLPVRMMELVPEEHQKEAAEIIARLVNAGMVGCPRPPQTTVRLNYVREVCKHLPIRCSMKETPVDKNDPDGRTYNALIVEPK